MKHEPRRYAEAMGELPPDEFLRPDPVLQSTVADRAAVLGPNWDGNGWKDTTDYATLHRDSALRGDFVRATYYATLLQLQEQRTAAREAHTANLIAYMLDQPLKSPLRENLQQLIEKDLL